MDYIRQMDKPNIIRPGEVVHFGLHGWATIIEVDPILPGVVSENYAGSRRGVRAVANVVVRTDKGERVAGTDCDIMGWLVPETGAMTIHDARICLPSQAKCAL
jgi:hypothetical protein